MKEESHSLQHTREILKRIKAEEVVYVEVDFGGELTTITLKIKPIKPIDIHVTNDLVRNNAIDET